MDTKGPMVERIRQELGALTDEHDVRILHACEGGSRAWGFASVDSDFDVRFVFARSLEEYLRLSPRRDVIDPPIMNELDFVGWDIFKCMQLLRRSNPPLLEHLGSPILYKADPAFTAAIQEEARNHYSRRACCEHYLSMAQSNFGTYVSGRARVIRKKYLYVLRPLACVQWSLEKETFPPTVFSDVLAGIRMPEVTRRTIATLLQEKTAGHEMDEAPAIAGLSEYITERLDQSAELVKQITGKPFPEDGLNRILRRTLLRS